MLHPQPFDVAALFDAATDLGIAVEVSAIVHARQLVETQIRMVFI